MEYRVKVRCAAGHEYEQTLYEEPMSLGDAFRRLVPCCGACGDRENYSLEFGAGDWNPQPMDWACTCGEANPASETHCMNCGKKRF